MQINYIFSDKELLKLALTHPSTAKKQGIRNDTYERLEFLGDSILGMIIAELLYKAFPEAGEGELSIMHARLVSKAIIAEIAKEIKLGEKLIMDIGEEVSGGRDNLSNLENAMEALIAAVYLDSDYQIISNIIKDLWYNYFQEKDLLVAKNVKSQLQELAQKMKLTIPVYKVVEKAGLEHSPTFKIGVSVAGLGSAIGEGKSKKEAEISAAANLLKILEENGLVI